MKPRGGGLHAPLLRVLSICQAEGLEIMFYIKTVTGNVEKRTSGGAPHLSQLVDEIVSVHRNSYEVPGSSFSSYLDCNQVSDKIPPLSLDLEPRG